MREELIHSWREEFDALGSEAVRREMRSGRWPQEKVSAAKYWLQLQDINAWQASGPVRPRSFRLRTWAQSLMTGFALIYAAARLFRLMRYGI